MGTNKNLSIFAVLKTNNYITMKNQKITEKEWELITALRNFRNAKYFSEWQLELHINALVEELKEEDITN